MRFNSAWSSREGMTGYPSEERGLKASGGQCQQPKAVLQGQEYAKRQQASIKFASTVIK
jgi:hypothetical protein